MKPLHNQVQAKVKSGVRAGVIYTNHNQAPAKQNVTRLKVKSGVKAGEIGITSGCSIC